ncbi:MAG: TetR/AcrR family transcriptional regulator [Candidatus Omnitrophica bacterium]|nr:TetR/AcrR family transcriptional regulator [Candidatus Omnitrophota bacterium]
MKDKRNLILKTAEKLISEKGYTRTTIEQIANKAKIGKGTFYLYFKNKEDLFISIIDKNLENLMREIRKEVEKISDFFDRLKKGIEIYLIYFEKNYTLFKILLQEKPFIKGQRFETFWKGFFKKWDFFIKKGFEEQIKNGRLKDFEFEDILYSLIGIIHGNIHRWIINGRKYPLREKKDLILEIFTEGIKRR